jgi:hypothetical protein
MLVNRVPGGRRYNIRMPTIGRPSRSASRKRQRHPIYATETAGLMLIAFLILAITLVRYWHTIHWSLR